MMNEAIPVPEINAQGFTKEVSELFPFLGKSAMGSRTKNVQGDNRASDPFLPMLKEGLRALNMVDETAPAVSGKDIPFKMEKGGAVKGGKITEGEPAIKKDQMSGAENAIVSQESDMPQDILFRILLLSGLPVKENSQDGSFITPKNEGIKTHERQIRNKKEIVLPLSPDTNQLNAIIGIISDALKKQGIEDDRIGEILSEIIDKGLFTAKEGREAVLPPGKSISEYDAEALGGERATNAVYETREAGMKPWRREEQASIIRIISDALKRQGVEDDRIGEILSEIIDKGLFTAKEGRKQVLPPVNSISEYDAEALGGELATSAVYEMPETGMKPWRQEEQASTIRIISDALKRHGIEDDGIGEILSEIIDKGLFTAKEGRKQVLPPVNSISEYDAEALGGALATSAVYEMPEAGMKPWRQEEQASTIRIISDALKRHGIEDDGIGEILSEIKDKGLFTAKEGRKQVLPPVNSISEYDAEALGGERATNAVYETPEAGMKPWRREEQASIIRIISDALKRHGVEDDGIGEILSEIKDKGLFTAKEGSKPVLPPVNSISEYDAEALGGELATSAVYEMPEAGMKPWRQEEQASTIRIISDALKRHGIEDDGIGEILSEVKDKGLFTAKEGRKPVLPPGKNIIEYDAEALGGERATNAVYEMPEAGMKPWRQEEQASIIRIISDALKRQGIEDDGIGEILSEVKDKGLFAAKEGRKPVLPPGKNIIDYDAEALGGERATSAVYEMPEAGMKPWRQEEQASTIRIISDALKRQGIEDDGIGEILSEIKDKGLFAAKEGRKPVLPPGKNIIEYEAEALGVERPTKAVYKMPEAGMKPWRQEDQASTGRASFPVKGDLLSIGGDKNIYVIRASSDTEGNEHAYDRKLPISLVFEKAASAREYDGPMTVSAYGGSAAVNKAGNAPYIDGRLLVNQIANQLSDETGKGFGRIKITLSPQNLGNLAMDIVVRENKVHVVMTAERHDVRQALQGHADQLKSALQQQGLQVHTIDFLLQGGHPGRDGGLGSGNLWWREENRKSENRNERAEKPSPAEIASSANGQKEGQGVEGISVFV